MYLSLPKPTRLYIKQCPITGLKYFGKTETKDIEKYPGSGKRWEKHLKKHQVHPIHLWNSDWYFDESISRFALKFSHLNRIVESSEWANQKPENGLDGGFTDKDREKSIQSHIKKYGCRSPFSVPEFKEKSKQTIKERFGVENAFQSEEVREKAKQTIKERFGVENAFQSEEVKQKIVQSSFERFGVSHHRKRDTERKRISEKNRSQSSRPEYIEYKKLAKEKGIKTVGKYLKPTEWLLAEIERLTQS